MKYLILNIIVDLLFLGYYISCWRRKLLFEGNYCPPLSAAALLAPLLGCRISRCHLCSARYSIRMSRSDYFHSLSFFFLQEDEVLNFLLTFAFKFSQLSTNINFNSTDMDIVLFCVVYDSRYFNTLGFESQIYFPRGVDEVLFFLEDSAFGLRLECPNSIRGHTEMFVFTILYLVLDRHF